MSFISTGLSAIGKLTAVVILLAAFLGGMAGVVYMSLSGEEIKVPEIVGKDFVESERELAALGLKIKRRADRPSAEKINTVLEQLPRPGETVKSGQMILVVVSKAGSGDETPKSLIKDIEADDTKKIEEMISDKPKKARSNSNTNSAKKKVDTTRDVIGNTATATDVPDGGNQSSENSNKKDTVGTPQGNKNTSTGPGVKPTPKPPAGEQRPRRQPQ